jgi:hypothetical protein
MRQTSTSLGSPTQNTAVRDEQVPHGAAANPREGGEQRETERVHALAGRHQRPGQREDGDADDLERDVLEEIH